MKPVVVQKYGGATLADPEKIKQIAKRLSKLHESGKNVIVVVSAMGKSTNDLIELAHRISKNPNRRELDMLLSTGERVSMSLLSIALNDLHCQAISFTGSQAGILTNDSHLNAHISAVKSPRIEAALDEGKIVVLAGFQGVSPISKEITTLGRGGSDITAIAVATAVKAEKCEILKDVEAVFSADPKIVTDAVPLPKLNHQQLMEMTFWGAKVLNYRSVELAFRNSLPLYIGRASEENLHKKTATGTMVETQKKEDLMFESNEILSINSHDLVLQIECQQANLGTALSDFEESLQEHEIASPQILSSSINDKKIQFFCTGPYEMMTAIQREFKTAKNFQLSPRELSAVSVTCTGSFNTEMPKKISKTLNENHIEIQGMLLSPMSVVTLVDRQKKNSTIQCLHSLIAK